MPTVTTEPITAYAHCPDSMCPGNEPVQIPALRERSDRTFAEWSDKSGLPPVPGVENTVFRMVFPDEESKTCEHCGRYLELSDQPRPTYQSMIKVFEGQGDPRYLLKLAAGGKVNAPGSREADERAVELRAEQDSKRDDEVNELRRQVAELTGTLGGFLAGQQARSKPGPKSRATGD